MTEQLEVGDLCKLCVECLLSGQNITLSLPKGANTPRRFPRGELLSVGSNGSVNYSYDPLKILAWAQKVAISELSEGQNGSVI